jgi:hypothetical protein
LLHRRGLSTFRAPSFGRLAQLVRALVSHTRGPGFESRSVHQPSLASALRLGKPAADKPARETQNSARFPDAETAPAKFIDASHRAAVVRSKYRFTMSIDKESSGLPEVNIHRRTTKVNFSIVIGIALFFAFTFGMVWWFWWSNR